MHEPYARYTISVPNSEVRHLAIHILTELGIEGFEETDEALIGSGPKNAVDATAIETYLQEAGLKFEYQLVANENWNAIWESSFEPVVVDDFVAIRADFHEPVSGVQFDLVITPKMSFGTGHHATTHLMMAQMRTLEFLSKSVFDFGTGTGILAILAEKLGASAVYAVDVDDWCVENTTENLARNGCTRVQVEQQDAPPLSRSFELVLANINKHILLAHMPQLSDITNPNGFLLLSGILVADASELIQCAHNHGFVHFTTSERNGWLAILLKKSMR